jgi:O-acetyl-ADP-ribose deacetylase (regulator of RNase III)
MKIVNGDLIYLARNCEFDLIVLGCNCFCSMGAGIGRGIKATFPAAFVADSATARNDRFKLSTFSFVNEVRVT